MVETVLSASDARRGLNAALDRFRREGAAAAPVVFGSHRKPEAVMLSYESYQRLLVDAALAAGIQVEYQGALESFTLSRPLGEARRDVNKALQLAAELDDASWLAA